MQRGRTSAATSYITSSRGSGISRNRQKQSCEFSALLNGLNWLVPRSHCSICREETKLDSDGQSLCPACDHKRHSVNALWEQVKLAKADHLALSNQFDQLNGEVVSGSHGMRYPDSEHAIERLGSQVRIAFRRFIRRCRLTRTRSRRGSALKGSAR